MKCEEGCGCEVGGAHAVVVSIDGTDHAFCCQDCADEYQGQLETDISRFLRTEVRRGETAVDLGCGSGYYTVRLIAAVGPRGTVYATDPDPDRLRRARSHRARTTTAKAVRSVHFVTGSWRVPDECADFVLSNNVLCCTTARPQAMEEILRVTRPGGRAYVRVGDMSVPRTPPVDAAEWAGLFDSWTVLREGASGSARWVLLSKPYPARAARGRRGPTPPLSRSSRPDAARRPVRAVNPAAGQPRDRTSRR